MNKQWAIALALVFTAGTPGFAQAPAVYTWTGMGVNVPGSSKCPTYKMNIEVTVTGKAVKGIFQQENRDQRHFETNLTKDGKIKTAAVVGGGNMMDVTGEITEAGGKIKLNGYCIFEGTLTKKQ